jgi:hypothetical protein
VRIFRERCVLSQQLAFRERERGQTDSAERLEEQARTADRYGELIRQYLVNNSFPVNSPPAAPEAAPEGGSAKA